MNRWTQEHNSFKDSKQWENLSTSIEKIDIKDTEDANNNLEILRLKKMVKFISGLFDAIDPEITPSNMWDNLRKAAQNCETQLTSNNYNEANNDLDGIFSRIRPFVTSEKKAAQAAARAFNSYTNTINKAIETLGTKSTDAVNQIEVRYSKIKEMHEDIEAFAAHLFAKKTEDENEETEDGLETKITKLFEEFQKNSEEVREYHTNIFTGTLSSVENEQIPSIKTEITQAVAETKQNSETTKEYLEEIEGVIKKLRLFYDKIFGKIKKLPAGEDNNDEDGQQREGGLKQELKNRQKHLHEYEDEQKNIHKILKEKIEDILPGATNASLASAYGERKKIVAKKAKFYTILFSCAIILLFAVGFFSAFPLLTKDFSKLASLDKFTFWMIRLIIIGPIAGPISWWAFFCSKRRSENSRLEEEYAHKEALAKSYNSYKQQIDNLEKKNEELVEKLLKTTIDAVAYNPSKTLDKKHGEKPNEIHDEKKRPQGN